MSERLTYLLARYLGKTASPAELEEFRTMAGLPEHEAFIKAEIEKAIEEGNHLAVADPAIGEEVYTRITDEHGIRSERTAVSLSFLRVFAGAAAVILAIGLGWYFSVNPLAKSDATVATEPKGETSRIYRGKNYIHLADGSTVLLQDSSVLTAIEKDGKFLREVILKGEAFFDISHDEAHTFIVHAGKVHTRVLGTAFNVRTQTGKVEVKVTRGLVEVGADEMIFGKLKAKEQIDVNTNSNAFSITQIKPVEKLPVPNTALTFQEASYSDVFEEIGKKFNYQIFLVDPELGRCRISANFTGQESLEDVLEAICATRNLEFSTELDKILIKGGTPCK